MGTLDGRSARVAHRDVHILAMHPNQAHPEILQGALGGHFDRRT